MHPKDIFHKEDVSTDRPLVSSAGMGERRSGEQEVAGFKPRPDQH